MKTKVLRVKKAVYLGCGFVSLALGFVGIFLPLLPTTPFVLLAAWFFFRSSERFYVWIHTHPKFGPMIQAWNERGAVPPAAKVTALITVSISLLAIWLTVKQEVVRISVTVFLACVLIFLFTRPND